MGIKTRILEQIKLKELSPDSFPEPDLKKKLDELKNSDQEILNVYPADMIKSAVTAKLNAASASQPDSEKAMSRRITAFLSVKHTRELAAFAAVLCLTVMIPLLLSRYRAQPVSEETVARSSGSERSKGTRAHIYLYRKEGDRAVQLADGSKAVPGDIIQISYVASGEKYGAIISIDGNGTVTQHYPDRGETAARLDEKGEIPLSYSYQLDNAPSFERFLLITGDTQFRINDFIQKLSSFPDKKYAERADLSKYLPVRTRETDVLLLK